MGDTSIQWTDKTWNPVRGCSRISPGCGGPGKQGGCYAEKIAARFSGPGQPFEGFAHYVNGEPRWTGKMALVPNMLELPLKWRTPSRIFVNSMSDLFHENLPKTDIATAFAIAVAAVHLRGHTLQILTKRAENMRAVMNDPEFWDQVNAEASATVMELVDPLDRRSDDARATLKEYGPAAPPPGIWLGVSVEDQQRADERIPHLLATPAAKRFLSCEPLLGPLDLTYVDDGAAHREIPREHWSSLDNEESPPGLALDSLSGVRRIMHGDYSYEGSSLDWVIVGGESGGRSRSFNIEWAREIVEQCKAAGVACFVKQLGADPFEESENAHPAFKDGLKDRKGGDMAEWPQDLRVREFPT